MFIYSFLFSCLLLFQFPLSFLPSFFHSFIYSFILNFLFIFFTLFIYSFIPFLNSLFSFLLSLIPCNNLSTIFLQGPKAPTISVSNKVYFRLDPKKKPIKIKIGDSLTTFKGTRVTIECPSTGFPDPRIRWNKNDISLAPQIPIFINGSMIILTNPEVSDTGKYTCLASNPGGNTDASSKVTFLGKFKCFVEYGYIYLASRNKVHL